MESCMNQKSWLMEKLENPRFRKGFEEEYHKLSVAEQLVHLRMQAGITQSELDKKTRTTASAISRYESADYDRYELNTIRKIVKACGGTLQIVINGPSDKVAV